MKTLVVSVIWLLGISAWSQVASGQQPAGNISGAVPASPAATGSSSLSFEAKSVSSGGATKVQNGGTTGFMGENLTSTQTHRSSIRLEVNVRNFGTAPAQGHLDCYFVATDFAYGRRYIWNTVSRDVPVLAGSEKKEVVESSPLTQVSERNYQSSVTTNPIGGGYQLSESATNRTSGSKPYGWIVRLMSGDRVLKVQASSSELEGVARDPSLIAKMQEQPKTPRPLPATPSPFTPRRQ